MTQGERQDYKWRPNTNDSTTRLRYDLEAEHWLRAFKSAERKHKPSSIRADLNVIGLFFQLAFTLITLVVILIYDCFKWLKSI